MMTILNSRKFSVAACIAAIVAGTVAAAEDPLAQYEREVRPILEQTCFKCHGAEKQKGGLRLDQKEGMLGGGDSGEPAVVRGKSAESHLIKLVTSTNPDEVMPQKAERLKPEQVAILKSWIDRGAHFPESGASADTSTSRRGITDADRQFWSFVPLRRTTPEIPADAKWPRKPLDRFILAKLTARGLSPSAEASRAVLARRLTFDLTGLPPTPEEIESFVADTDAGADERLVDRLLASPRFGERMASLWLPLARYAEDQAHQVGDDTKFFYPNAYKYREWVVGAFNRDLPYDQFIKLQLAADKIAPDELAALGFLGLGPKYYNRNRIEVMADEWEDRVDTVSRTMLGLTVACARCHDHKFDPISTDDYYALAGVFASTRMVNKTPDGRIEKENAKAQQMDPTVMHVVEDGDVQNLNVFIRGNAQRKGPVVERRFPQVLCGPETVAFREGSGRRELAEAIASAKNPLTARVMVNRVWGLLFGRPLVATPSNFGHSGVLPTHPELLDDLAARFIEGGWSVKALVREITLSATYRQVADSDAGKAGRDSDNALLWRMNRRRLTVEQWRDAVLFASGELNEGTGGASKELGDAGNLRRTLYARISRLKLDDLLIQFDYPDANVHAERRSVTTTPIQKLFMLNSPFMQRRASVFSARLQGMAESDDARVTAAYRILFGRDPVSRELDMALGFLRKPNASDVTRWEQYAQILLASNEMLYVD